MDEKDAEYLSLLPLFSEISALRQIKYHKRWIKETHRAEIDNLRNVEIELYTQKHKLVDPSKWPIANEVAIPALDLNQPIEEYHQIYAALDCLK